MDDLLIGKLREGRPGIDFMPATDAVIEKYDLKETGNQSYGANVYVATHNPPDINLSEFLIGKEIKTGTVEEYPNCSLECGRKGDKIIVGLYDADHRPICIELQVSSKDDSNDEALFAWLGPLEDICTPWSDNDDSQCQVITIQGLRAYAQKWKGKTGS